MEIIEAGEIVAALILIQKALWGCATVYIIGIIALIVTRKN